MSRLPPLLRPRLTWRYTFGVLIILYVIYSLVHPPILSAKLPPYSGPHAVGTIDIEVPCESRNISAAIRRDDGRTVLQLDTVLFSVYYPMQPGLKGKPPHYWVPKPISLTTEGYARFAQANNLITRSTFTLWLWALVGRLRIPASVDTALSKNTLSLETQRRTPRSTSRDLERHQAFPVLIFSHGFASSRTDYTHYLGELASRGYVVAAIEHRDGTGPASVIKKHGSEDQIVFPIRPSDIDMSDHLSTLDFKRVLLDFRQAEIEETVRVLGQINDGHGEDIFKMNSRNEGKDLNNWKAHLDMDSVTLGGHSFGANGALHSLKSAPSKNLPFKGGIMLDPGKNSGLLNDEINVPVLIVHSNSWSSRHTVFFGRPHFDVVKDLVQGVVARGKEAWFLTSLGTSHLSVTDAPLIQPLLLSWATGAAINVKEGVEEYVRVSDNFIDYQHTGQRSGLLAQPVSHPTYNDVGYIGRELDAEYAAYWQVHVAPGNELHKTSIEGVKLPEGEGDGHGARHARQPSLLHKGHCQSQVSDLQVMASTRVSESNSGVQIQSSNQVFL